MVFAILILIRHLLHWRFACPDFSVVSLTTLAFTPLAIRYQATVSQAQPLLTLGLAPAILFSADPAINSTILPIWSLLVAVGYVGSGRKVISVPVLTSIQVISGAALLAAARHIDLGFRPYDRAFLALTTYFAIMMALEMGRRAAWEHQSFRGLKLRWARVFLVGLGIYYAAAAVAAARWIGSGRPLPVDASAVVAFLGALVLSIGLARRNRELSRSLQAVVDAAVAMPWAREQIDENLKTKTRSALGSGRVELSQEPGTGFSISAQVDGGMHVVASRERGDLPFSLIEGGVLQAIAHMGASSLRQADQLDRLVLRANVDSLTGLSTYTNFRERVDEINISRDPGEKLGLIFIDLDGFKEVNDYFGHLAGDELLKAIAARLRRFMGVDGLVTRFGGDEFALLLRNVADLAELRRTAALVFAEIARPIPLGHDVARLHASLGIALSATPGDSIDDLVRAADQQMYRHKRLAHASDLEKAAQLDDAVRAAVKAHRLVAFYQPIVDLRSGKIIGFEALVRCTDPLLGPIPPEIVVKIASRLNLLDELTRQVSELAFSAFARIQETQPTIRHLYINVEVEQLAAWSPLLELLARRGAAGGIDIVLEISERSFGHWVASNTEIVRRLRLASVGAALDDFGVGYSSLGSLPLAPVGTVKIDKSLVVSLRDPRQELLMRRIVAMMGDLDLTVVVEGVETAEIADRLLKLGGTLAQGLYFGYAQSLDETMRRLREHGDAAVVAG